MYASLPSFANKYSFPSNTGSSNQQTYQHSIQRNQYQHQPQQSQAETTSSVDYLVKDFMVINNQLLNRNDKLIQSQASSIRNLEVQVGQLTSVFQNCPIGRLSSNTKAPHRDKEQCKATTLHGGKKLQDEPITSCRPKETNKV